MMKGKTENKFQYFMVDFGSIHLIPTICVYMALLPMIYALAYPGDGLNLLDAVATLLAVIAVIIQIISDQQMYNFRKKGTPFKSKNVSYLYCISKYPTNLSEVKMPDFKKSFFTGYSDHTVGIGTCLHAVSRGAKIIEKHFTLNKAINCETEKAHVCSMNFEDLKTLRENADILSTLNS